MNDEISERNFYSIKSSHSLLKNNENEKDELKCMLKKLLTVWQLVDRFVWKWQKQTAFYNFREKWWNFLMMKIVYQILDRWDLLKKQKKNKSFVNYFTSFFDNFIDYYIKQKQWLEIKLKKFLNSIEKQEKNDE